MQNEHRKRYTSPLRKPDLKARNSHREEPARLDERFAAFFDLVLAATPSAPTQRDEPGPSLFG